MATVTISGLSAVAAGTTAAFFTAPSIAACGTTATATALPLAPNTSSVIIANADKTTFTLASPLVQGQIICAKLSTVDVALGAVTVAAAVLPPGFDWGLVKAYFTFGALLSQQDSQLSHQDLFLSFHLDRTFRQTGNINSSGNRSYKPGLNSFFEPRLTALPVAVQPCAQSSGSSTSNPATSSCSSTSTGNTSNTATDPTQVFLNSQKSARLEFGVYMPMLLNRWSITEKKGTNTNQADYAMYIAPIVKTGFDTSLNGLNQTQQQGSTPSSVKPVGTSAQFYKFYDYGFRLGHYQLSQDPAHAPDSLSFLDVSFGRFSNMASLLCPLSENNGDGTCGSSTAPPTLSWAHDYRINVEGLLEIPGTSGFSVGFSTNVAAHSAPHSVIDGITYVHLRPADDLRFLFAYKFDITKLFGKLASKPSS